MCSDLLQNHVCFVLFFCCLNFSQICYEGIFDDYSGMIFSSSPCKLVGHSLEAS